MMKLNYKKMGTSGTTVVILHGLFGNRRNWQSIARHLSQDYLVYTIDLRNHGKSAHTDIMNYNVMVDDIIEFRNTHKLPKFILIGHSMGGKVAMLLALSQLQHIQQLVIVDIAPVSYQHNFEDIFEGLFSLPLSLIKSRRQADQILSNKIATLEIRQFLLQNLSIEGNKKNNNSFWHFNLKVLYDSISNITNFPTLAKGVKSPVKSLFIAGENSDYINSSNRKIIKDLFPHSNIVKIKGAGHWLHAEKPEVLKKILTGFLKY